MKRHLKRVHPELWVQLEAEDEERREAASVEKERRKEKLDRSRSVGCGFMPEHHLYKIWVKLRLHVKFQPIWTSIGRVIAIRTIVDAP